MIGESEMDKWEYICKIEEWDNVEDFLNNYGRSGFELVHLENTIKNFYNIVMKKKMKSK